MWLWWVVICESVWDSLGELSFEGIYIGGEDHSIWESIPSLHNPAGEEASSSFNRGMLYLDLVGVTPGTNSGG